MITDRLRELLAKGTPPPWRWYHDKWQTMLSTPDRGRIYVMGFARRGMQGAQPMFQVREVGRGPGGGVMRTAAELGLDGIRSHPDAALIVEAVNAMPALLDVVDAAKAIRQKTDIRDKGWHDLTHARYAALDEALERLDAL